MDISWLTITDSVLLGSLFWFYGSNFSSCCTLTALTVLFQNTAGGRCQLKALKTHRLLLALHQMVDWQIKWLYVEHCGVLRSQNDRFLAQFQQLKIPTRNSLTPLYDLPKQTRPLAISVWVIFNTRHQVGLWPSWISHQIKTISTAEPHSLRHSSFNSFIFRTFKVFLTPN